MIAERIKALNELHSKARALRLNATNKSAYDAYLDAESSIWNLATHLEIAGEQLAVNRSSDVVVMVNDLLVVADDVIRIYKEAL